MGLKQRPPSWQVSVEDTRSWRGGQRLRKGWPRSGHQASLSGEGGRILAGAGTLQPMGPCPHSSSLVLTPTQEVTDQKEAMTPDSMSHAVNITDYAKDVDKRQP